MNASQLGAVASVITALSVLVTAVANARGRRTIREQIETVHDQVKTSNGRTLGELVEEAKARDVAQDAS